MRPPKSFVGQPVRSLQTMLRVIARREGGLPTVIPDGIYGKETMAAVSAFQRKHGLPATGVTDGPTWEAIAAVFAPARVSQTEAEPLRLVLNPNQTIRKGEAHPLVYLVQSILAMLSRAYQSVSPPALSGVLDDATAEALASFQYLVGLPATGVLDALTWKHLSIHAPLAANLLNPSES